MEQPYIYVIVPIYNVERYIARCLDSLINQTYQRCAFILIDDGSTDSSGEIAKNYLSRDKRLHLISTHNKGVSSARNTGIDYADQIGGGCG